MTQTAGHGPYTREHPRGWDDKSVPELPQGLIDDMVRRLLEEWNRQMIRVERTSKSESERRDEKGNLLQDDPKRRDQQARTLASLQRSLENIMRMEQERAVKRSVKATLSPQDAVAALQRRLDKLLEHDKAQGIHARAETQAGGVSS